MLRNRIVTALVCGSLAGYAWSQTAEKVDFRRDVQPIFKQNCIGCHGPAKQMNGFRLDQRRYAMPNRIGANGARITPGNSENSPLYLKISSDKFGLQMPPTGPLNDQEIQIIKRWIEQGADWPDDADPPARVADVNATQLISALRKGDRTVIDKILNADPGVVNKATADGTTPLMYAALYGDAQIVRLMFNKGADPNLKNDVGATALMWAVADVQKSGLLIEHGADVNAQSADGRTPLMIAATQYNAAAVVKLLLDHGAQAAVKIGAATPLSIAAPFADENVLRSLLDHGADGKGAGPGVFGALLRSECRACLDLWTPLVDRTAFSTEIATQAAPVESVDKIRFLIGHGADVNTVNAQGRTALMTAAYSDLVPSDTVRLLIEHGADVNVTNRGNETALKFALQRGHTTTVDLLLKAGAKGETVPENPVPRPSPAASVREAVQRTLPVLQRTDKSFFQKSGCISCHNNSLTSMTVVAARQHHFPVDEQIQREQMKDTANYLETWRDRLIQGIGIPGGPDTGSYILLGLAADNYPASEATDAMARFLKLRQAPDGHWNIGANRPPIESSDIELTSVSLRALQSYAPLTQRTEYNQAVRRAAEWLARAQPKTNEDRVFQLFGLSWANGSKDAVGKAGRDLLQKQREDGGWGQLESLKSDAYATGQALVALKDAGVLKVSDAAYKRGVQFLLNSQFEDGSWYVKSRVIKIQPYFDNGFPHGNDQWISAAATNWATMALIRDSR